VIKNLESADPLTVDNRSRSSPGWVYKKRAEDEARALY
jgi:hypothetical protein